MTQQNRRQFATLMAAGTLGLGALTSAELRAQNLPDLLDQFFEAVRRGNVERVRAFLAQDARLALARQRDGLSAFAAALKARHPMIGQLLREHGYQPDLHESALAQDWERLDHLAPQSPGQVNVDHPIGGSAMYAAALGGAGTDMWRIYRYGGAPSRAFSNFGSPLLAALSFPDLATAEMTASTLLANGADPNGARLNGTQSDSAETRASGTSGAVRDRSRSENVASTGRRDEGASDRTSAAPGRSGSSRGEQPGDWLSEAGTQHWTPLHLAARRGSHELVEMLMRKGADTSATSAQGHTPLALAEAAGHQESVELLRNPDRIPREHSTSRRLYNADGEPYRAPDLSAFAALARENLVGASHRNLDAIRDTVASHPHLAHSVATTTEGAVEAGAHMGRQDIVEFLLDHGAPYSLPTAVMRNDAKAVARLLDEDPKRIHERGAHDFPLLWYPVIGRTGPAMLEELLRRGAEVERQHYLGTTVLHFAAARDQPEMAEFLLEQGADINRVGRKFSAQGHAPLDLARGKTADLLRSRGARPHQE